MKTRITKSKLIAISAIGIILGLAGMAYFFIPSTASNSNEPAATTAAAAQTAYGKLPLSFEANQGQTDSQVKFLARGSGYTLFLTGAEAVLRLRNEDRRSKIENRKSHDSARSASHNPQSSVLRMKLVGANPSPQAAGLDKLPGKSNYFIGNDPKEWRKDIPTYAKVKFAAVYPGVDVVYYGAQGRQLEYDFIVAPQADPKAIRLSFEGADKLEVDGQGDLLLRTAGKALQMRKPVVYQEKDGVKQEIAGSYALTGEREIAFEIAAYDTTRPLVIDPILVYSTFLGGAGQERGVEIVVNEHGNAFVTGFTTSPDFPTEPDDVKFGPGGGIDAFVTKFNAAGNQLIYSTYLGGSSNENYYPELDEIGPTYGGIAIDSSDNAYVTGLTRSPDFPITLNNAPKVYQEKLKGLSDAFVTKLNAAGNALVYSTFLGCNGVNAADGGQGIAVDAFGQAYVTGFDYSGGLPSMVFQHSAGIDGYVAKLNTTGSALLYSTYFGGNSDNLGWGIAVDGYQNAFVTGETVSTNFPTIPDAFDITCGTDGACNPVKNPKTDKYEPQADIFVIKMDTKIFTKFSHIYSTYLGGSKEERYNFNASIAVDTAGELIYLTGLTASVNPVDFPIWNAPQPLPNCYPSSCSAEAFITKLDISLPLKPGFPSLDQIVYSTYLGGPGTEIGTGIAADVNGNAYVAGASGGTFPSTAGMSLCTDPGVFVAKLGANGAIKYATCISGLGQDTGLDLAIDPVGCVYVTGWTESNNYPTVNAFQKFFAGGTGDAPSDGFVTKLCSGLDHFKCYDVRAQENFQPFDVILRDQFETQKVTVLRPATLCNPVIKCVENKTPSTNPTKPDCTPRLNPDDHLVCYETMDDRGTPQFEQREVIVSNQFGKEQRLTVWRRKNLLCIPSLKAHVEPGR
ncbi:MAG: SBBP repeat-containing protein [Acidobacteria bacterium]|nr:SBBP repeat-containing protein [Acidobacteriota bacterium]